MLPLPPGDQLSEDFATGTPGSCITPAPRMIKMPSSEPPLRLRSYDVMLRNRKGGSEEGLFIIRGGGGYTTSWGPCDFALVGFL